MASPSRLPSARRPAGTASKARPTSMFEVPSEHMKRLKQIGDSGRGRTGDLLSVEETNTTSKQAKRRSLLPTFSSRKASGDEKETIASIREDTSDSEVSSRPVTRDDTKAMPPPPKPARPTSMRVPGSTMPTKPLTSSHTRNNSKESNVAPSKTATQNTSNLGIPQKTETGIKRAGSTRLPQSPRIGAPGTSGQQAIPTRGSSARVTASTSAQKRSSVVVSKPSALDTNISPQGGGSQASPTSPTGSTASRQSSKTNLPPSSRPAFSTYQQHYSPAKSSLPKPPVPGIKATKPVATTPSTESEVPLTIETVLDQVELLQLSLLHQNAGTALQEYDESAHHHLHTLHADLQAQYQSLQSSEQEHRRTRNLLAIETWCPDAALLTESLQTLNRVVSDLRTHTEAGSRYSELTSTFDTWANKAESILFSSSAQPASFIEGLPESWRSIHTSLALKFRSIQRELSTLPPAPPSSETETPSSLEIILENCFSMVESMLKELEIMTKLQKEVLQQGKTRIDEQISALIAATNSSESNKENWTPAWQRVT